jgi:peptidoglycan/xylan/chitin deacetylase (PgdA/CDA1 family)
MVRKFRKQNTLISLLCGLILILALLVALDARHPHFYMTGDQTLKAEQGQPFEDPGVYAVLSGRIFGDGRRRLPIETSGSVDPSVAGDYILRYRTHFFFRDYVCTRTVEVRDRTAPVIVLYQRDGYQVNWLDGYVEEGYRAEDNMDGDLTALVRTEETADGIVYTVSDRAGNRASVLRRPNYTIARPEIYLTGGNELYVKAAFQFGDPGYLAIDRLGNDMTAFVVCDGEVIPYRAGTYELSYSITNAAGQTVRAVRTVTVEPQQIPGTIQPEEKTIYLTFDDGPGPDTERLLKMLDKYDVKATFFVTASQPKYLPMIAKAHEAGHKIGVHTYSHNYDGVYASEEAFFDDFLKMQDIILRQTGSYADILRFPGGSSNTVSSISPGIMTMLTEDVRSLGYQYFDWNVKSGDAGETTHTSAVVQNVTEGIAALPEGEAAIVLQHDTRRFSVDAVEKIIQWGLENGYTFRSLDRTSPPAHLDVAN